MIEEKAVKEELHLVMEKILNYLEVATPPDIYLRLRSKVLRIGNDAIRNLTMGGEQCQKKD